MSTFSAKNTVVLTYDVFSLIAGEFQKFSFTSSTMPVVSNEMMPIERLIAFMIGHLLQRMLQMFRNISSYFYNSGNFVPPVGNRNVTCFNPYRTPASGQMLYLPLELSPAARRCQKRL